MAALIMFRRITEIVMQARLNGHIFTCTDTDLKPIGAAAIQRPPFGYHGVLA